MPDKFNKGQSMPAAPIITTDDRVMCYSCYQEDDGAELMTWVDQQPDNFPCECDACGMTMTMMPESPFPKTIVEIVVEVPVKNPGRGIVMW